VYIFEIIRIIWKSRVIFLKFNINIYNNNNNNNNNKSSNINCKSSFWEIIVLEFFTLILNFFFFFFFFHFSLFYQINIIIYDTKRRGYFRFK